MRGDHHPPTASVTAAAAALRDLGHAVDISCEPSDTSSDVWIVRKSDQAWPIGSLTHRELLELDEA
jgi:hypothetical protein